MEHTYFSKVDEQQFLSGLLKTEAWRKSLIKRYEFSVFIQPLVECLQIPI